MVRERRERSDDSAPPATTPPRRAHPWDQAPLLQMVRDVEHSVVRLDERSEALREEISRLRDDVRGMIGRGAFWTGIGVVVAVIVAVTIGLGQAYWTAISMKFDAIATRFDTLEKMRQPIIVQMPQQAVTPQSPVQQNQGQPP